MKNRPLCSVCVLVFILLCISIWAGGEKFLKELRPSPLEKKVREDEMILFTGQVYQKEVKEKYQVLYLKNISVIYQQQSLKESKIIVYDENKIEICIGDIITGNGVVSFFESARNPGNFDQKLYYQKQDIHASVWAEEMKVTKNSVYPLRNKLYELRKRWSIMLYEAMGEKDGATFSAILLGEKSGMDRELKKLYQVNGIAHIIAVSGLHLSFIGIGMYKVFRRITGSYPVGGAFGILFLVLYILMIGLTVSALRALVMFLFRVGADMAGRHYDAPTALAVAAVVVLLWRPLSLYDGGFWLSFGAVFAILAAEPIVQGNWSVGKKEDEDTSVRTLRSTNSSSGGLIKSIGQGILQGLKASVSINLIIFPILLYYFFEFPLYSFILNLFVIPLMSVLLFLGIVGSILGLLGTWAAPFSDLTFRLCKGIFWLYKESCDLALGLPGARLVIGKPELWQMAVYYGILIFVLYILRGRLDSENDQKCSGEKTAYSENQREITGRYRCRKSLAVLLWTAGLFIMVFRWGENGKLTMVVLDVGQGDGIFMKGPDGGTYLIDGGSSDVKKVGQYRLEPFLESQGVGTLDYVLISHGDGDHMNGVEELIEQQDVGVKIRTLVLPVREVWDEALTGLAEKAERSGIRVVTIEAGESIREGRMAITCIQPGSEEILSKNTESGQKSTEPASGSVELEPGNAASMVLAVQYGGLDMLLTGDVEEEGEEMLTRRLEEQYQDCTWEVLKAAHHGSKNSSSKEFLGQVQPAYALVSAGRDNRYGHPHQETIERLREVGSKIYSTQENGAVIVEVKEGKALRIKKY